MTSRLLISLSLLLLSWQPAGGQSADDFFHAGAQSYLSNNVALAREEVDKGLRLYPDDIKLKKLDELLKQPNQQQQSKDDQQKQEQDKKDQPSQQAQSQQEEAGQQDRAQQEQNQQGQRQASSKPGEKPGEAQQQETAVAANQMTPEQACQLLDAQKGEEKVLWFKPGDKAGVRGGPIKDW